MIDIKAFRIAKNLLQKDLAEILGISRTFYTSIEKGRRTLPSKYVEILRAKYGAEIDKFVVDNPYDTISKMKDDYERRLEELRQQVADLIETNKLLALELKNRHGDARREELATAVGAER